MRLSDDSNIDSVIDLIENQWHMLKPRPPKLVITVIGGAKNFELERKKKDMFERGLVKASILACVHVLCFYNALESKG